jgi:hypothetical protein
VEIHRPSYTPTINAFDVASSLAPETWSDFAVYMARLSSRGVGCDFGVACGSFESKMLPDDLNPKAEP